MNQWGCHLDNVNASGSVANSHYEKFADGRVVCIDDEIPFEIPSGWEWIRLRMVAEVARGGSPRPIKEYLTESANGVNWIKIGDAEKGGKYINGTRERIKREGVSKSRMIHKGDFLLTNSMSFGRPYISNIDGCIHDGWLVISPALGSFTQDFLFYLLSSRFAYDQFCGKVSGAVVQNLNSDKVAEAIIPIPPLAEQKRIVAFLEKILPLVEKYGLDQEEQDRLNASILSKLNKSILQEAIQGRLTKQDLNDEPVIILLEKIRNEKQKLLKEGKLKKKDIMDSVIFKGEDNKYYEKVGGKTLDISEEIPFDLPESWNWCRLASIVHYRIGKTPARGETSFWEPGTIPWVSISDMKDYGTVDHTKESVSNKATSILGQKSPKGTLLMSFKLTVGRTAVLDIDAYHNEAIVSIWPFATQEALKEFLFYALPVLANLGDSKDAIKGKTLNTNSINNLLIPLPPEKEQFRIVKRIKELYVHL